MSEMCVVSDVVLCVKARQGEVLCLALIIFLLFLLYCRLSSDNDGIDSGNDA